MIISSIYIVLMLAPILLAIGRSDNNKSRERILGFIYLCIPTILILYSTKNMGNDLKIFFVIMQVLWYPLIRQDIESKFVNGAWLFFTTSLTVAYSAYQFDDLISRIIQATAIVLFFFFIQGIYVKLRRRSAFGLGDFPVFFALSISLELGYFGVWLLIVSLLGLAQGIAQKTPLEGTTAMIPPLFLGWQYTMSIGLVSQLI